MTDYRILRIYSVHDDVKDKDFELEMSWICEESDRKHQRVPAELLQQAIKEASALKDGGSSDEEMID
jgi:20S proteasome subunit alpha 7